MGKVGRGEDMSKKEWLKHMAEVGEHDKLKCSECHRRVITLRAARNRKLRDEVGEICGLVKVRGALGGTYWE